MTSTFVVAVFPLSLEIFGWVAIKFWATPELCRCSEDGDEQVAEGDT
jgi:hypothetical protein